MDNSYFNTNIIRFEIIKIEKFKWSTVYKHILIVCIRYDTSYVKNVEVTSNANM